MSIKLTPSQARFVLQFSTWFTGNNTIAVLEADGGAGKAQPLDEPVLTPTGFKTMQELQAGDFVISEEGKPIQVLQTFEHEELTMYELMFSDGSSTKCCEDHLWKVQSKEMRMNGTFRVKPLKDLLQGINKVITGKQGYIWSIPLTKPVEFEDRAYDLSPYSMGYILGNGSSARYQLIVSLDNKDASEIISFFKQEEILSTELKKDGVFRFAVSSKQRKYYDSFGLNQVKSIDKFIPTEYLLGSRTQRKELLAGLLDSDGSCCKNKATFSSSSSKLVEDFCWLVRSLGGTATPSKQNRGLEWNVCFRTPFNPFKLQRKAERYEVRPIDVAGSKRIVSAKLLGVMKGKCLLVDSKEHLYLTKDFTVTHNTYVLKYALEKQPHFNFKQKALILAETNEAVLVLLEKLGTGYEHIKTVCSAFNLVHGVNSEGEEGLTQHREPEFEGITLLCIDEASMLSSTRLKMILDVCKAYGIYVLLIGDRKQLPSPEDEVDWNSRCDSVAFVEQWYVDNGFQIPVLFKLTENKRSSNEHYEFCTKVGKLQAEGAKGFVPDKYMTPFSALRKYLQAFEGRDAFLKSDAVVLAYTNKRVAELNQLVRKELFGKDSQDPFLEGDRIIFRQPTKCFERIIKDGNNYFDSLISQKGVMFTTNTKAVVKKVGYKTVLGMTVVELYIHSNHFVKGLQDGFIYIPLERKEAFDKYCKMRQQAMYTHGDTARQKAFERCRLFCSIFNVGINAFKEDDCRRDTKHGYGLTVHCSQGSSIPDVFVDEKDLATIKNKHLRLKVQYVAYSRVGRYIARLI